MTVAVQPSDRPRHGPEVVWRPADEGVLLLKPSDGQYFTLDEVGARVWSLCDGRRSAAQIGEALASEYEADADTIRADVLDLLTELADEGLVDVD